MVVVVVGYSVRASKAIVSRDVTIKFSFLTCRHDYHVVLAPLTTTSPHLCTVLANPYFSATQRWPVESGTSGWQSLIRNFYMTTPISAVEDMFVSYVIVSTDFDYWWGGGEMDVKGPIESVACV